MKLLTIDKENLTDEQLSKVVDLFTEIHGDEFRQAISQPYTFTIVVETESPTKSDKISEINRILEKCFDGETSTAELEASSSPCISSSGTNRMNVSVLVERFSVNNVGVFTYNNETEIAENDMSYEELDEEIIDEILGLLEDAEVEYDKDWERCQG